MSISEDEIRRSVQETASLSQELLKGVNLRDIATKTELTIAEIRDMAEGRVANKSAIHVEMVRRAASGL